MEQNPYQPPTVALPTLEDEQPNKHAPRPLGICILSGLHLLAGLFFVAATCFLLWQFVTGEDNPSNLPYWFEIPLGAFMGFLALSSSVGMWRGARWGWWLGAFYYVWAALGVVAEIPNALWHTEGLDQELVSPLLVGKLVRLAVFVLLALYFFKGSVREFFGLKSLRIVPTLNALTMISLLLLAGTTAVAFFLIGAEQ